MAMTSIQEFRARATQARRISENMHTCSAKIELRDMADALDAEADRLESDIKAQPTPTNGARPGKGR